VLSLKSLADLGFGTVYSLINAENHILILDRSERGSNVTYDDSPEVATIVGWPSIKPTVMRGHSKVPSGMETGLCNDSSKWTASGVPEKVPGSATMSTVYSVALKASKQASLAVRYLLHIKVTQVTQL